MCLTVTKIERRIVKECRKQLCVNEYKGKIETPHQFTSIPDDGLLVPVINNGFISDKPKFGDRIHGGFIHAYSLSKDWEDLYSAYAIYQEALGYNDDLICRALYIPKLDRINNSKKIVKELLKCKRKEHILEIFPRLMNRV